ncbi:MAG: hypothetical protein QM737_16230 [Ferruginibacter sp.]
MKKCFIISPIGQEGSDVRKEADNVFNFIIKPATKKCNVEPWRSDHLDKPGKISDQMFEALHTADLCIAILTGKNPNVFYELAVAQSANRPVIILIKKGEDLPFDVSDFRCIAYDFDPDFLKKKVYENKIIAFIKDIEAADWKATDIFSKYRHTHPAPAREVVEFDAVKYQPEKTFIFKVLNLKSMLSPQEVAYEKYLNLLGKNLPIISEVMTIRVNKFDTPVHNFKSRDRTSGDAVELMGLLPFCAELEDTDKNPIWVEPIVKGPSDTFIIVGHTYNGFKPGDFDLKMKVEKDTGVARFVVDFSSIPNFDKLISTKPKLTYYYFKDNEQKKTEMPMEYTMLAPGIFFTEKRNMKKEEVLGFDFAPAENGI